MDLRDGIGMLEGQGKYLIDAYGEWGMALEGVSFVGLVVEARKARGGRLVVLVLARRTGTVVRPAYGLGIGESCLFCSLCLGAGCCRSRSACGGWEPKSKKSR